MKLFARLFVIGFVFGILYLGVSHVLALESEGEIHHLARWIFTEMRRSEALQQRRLEQTESETLKKAVIEDYLGARLTLREAVQQFREADELVQDRSESLVAPYIAPESEQDTCLQVKVWMDMALKDNNYPAEKATEIQRRFEDEMDRLFPPQHRIN